MMTEQNSYISAEWVAFRDEQCTLEEFLSSGYLDAPIPVSTGIAELDQVLGGGLHPGLNLLGGEAGAGKSSIALQIAWRLAFSQRCVVFVSLEMPTTSCVMRILSNMSTMTGMAAHGITPFTWSNVSGRAQKAREKLAAVDSPAVKAAMMNELAQGQDPIITAAYRLFKQYPGLSITDKRELHDLNVFRCLAHDAAELGACLLIVDYLQELRDESRPLATEYEQVNVISETLAMIGHEYRMPVLALSSMNRDYSDSKPGMHDFKGSSNLEHDAESAMVICRERDASLPNGLRPVEIHVVKNRAGILTNSSAPIKLAFDGAHSLLDDRQELIRLTDQRQQRTEIYQP